MSRMVYYFPHWYEEEKILNYLKRISFHLRPILKDCVDLICIFYCLCHYKYLFEKTVFLAEEHVFIFSYHVLDLEQLRDYFIQYFVHRNNIQHYTLLPWIPARTSDARKGMKITLLVKK